MSTLIFWMKAFHVIAPALVAISVMAVVVNRKHPAISWKLLGVLPMMVMGIFSSYITYLAIQQSGNSAVRGTDTMVAILATAWVVLFLEMFRHEKD